MELNFSDLKKKKVVNVLDGKDLGKVNDAVFTFPDGKICAFITSKKGLFCGDELIINLCCIEKIGDDAILVRISGSLDDACKVCE